MTADAVLKEQNSSKTMKPVTRMGEGIPPEIPSRIEEIVQSVNKEFGTIARLLAPIVVRMDLREGDAFDATKSPGVYVFVDENGMCLKIGKSQSNASKRALQHCGSDNTSSKDGKIHMADRLNSDKTYMLVFALQDTDSLHWVLALEHYLEKQFTPQICSQRNG